MAKAYREESPPNRKNQSMSTNNSAAAVFHAHSKAEEAVRELQKSGFDMTKLSIVGKDYHTDELDVGYDNAAIHPTDRQLRCRTMTWLKITSTPLTARTASCAICFM